MAHEAADNIPGWQYGLDPQAEGLAIRSITREQHRLGEALRLELAPMPGDSRVHVQWYIATRVGPWAMWTACRPEDVDARETVLRGVDWFGARDPGEPLAEVAR
jgi:hypothetical protein